MHADIVARSKSGSNSFQNQKTMVECFNKLDLIIKSEGINTFEDLGDKLKTNGRICEYSRYSISQSVFLSIIILFQTLNIPDL